MTTVTIEPNISEWRSYARQLLSQKIHPNDVIWNTTQIEDNELFGSNLHLSATVTKLTVPPFFLQLAESVSCHRSGKQWAMLYSILWAITYEKNRDILADKTNDTMRKLEQMRKNISRDIHKMRAFVRFRQVESAEQDRENYIAWYEPEHLILRANSPFFRKRFGGMNWSILTPDECAHWDGSDIHYTEGVDQSQAPDSDALEELWKGYYRSIFNPARLKIKMMQSEMPKKYWKNLPEAEIIEELIQNSTEEVNSMMARENRPLKAKPNNLYLDHLDKLNRQAPDA